MISCKSCNKSISSIVQIQQHKSFEDSLSQAKLIQEVKFQLSDIKLCKKNQNQKCNDNSQAYHEKQYSQPSYEVNQTNLDQPTMHE